MAVTLKQVALQAGVSITTVSRILNGKEVGIPIREDTRQRVLAVASQLGYRPNLMARSLRGSPSSLVGVIVRDISDPFISLILKGMNQASLERNYRLFLGHVGQQPNQSIDYGSMFEQAHADGIMIIGDMQGDEAAVDYLLSKHQYVLGVTDRSERRSFPGVYSDSGLGAELAMQHLWELGHRRIVCVSDAAIHDGRWRAEGYERFMREHGDRKFSRIYWAPRSFAGGHQVGKQIFAQRERPSAIFACTDTIAIGLIEAAYQAHLNIPDDVSIIGFDDIEIAAYTTPPLTTISQAGFEMGYSTTNLLITLIEQGADPTDVQDVLLTPTLIARQSTKVCLQTIAT